jgi:hypothetical protein
VRGDIIYCKRKETKKKNKNRNTKNNEDQYSNQAKKPIISILSLLGHSNL